MLDAGRVSACTVLLLGPRPGPCVGQVWVLIVPYPNPCVAWPSVRIVKGQYKVQADATGSWIRPCGSSIYIQADATGIVDQAQALERG